MAGFKDSHSKRLLTERVTSQVAELFYSHNMGGHAVRITAMLGASGRLLDNAANKAHGNSTKAKEGARLAGELLKLQYEIEHYFAEHCGELPE